MTDLVEWTHCSSCARRIRHEDADRGSVGHASSCVRHGLKADCAVGGPALVRCSACGRDLVFQAHGLGCPRAGMKADRPALSVRTEGETPIRGEPMFPLPQMTVPPRPDPDPLARRADWPPLLAPDEGRLVVAAFLLLAGGFAGGARAYGAPWWSAIVCLVAMIGVVVVLATRPGPNDPPRGCRCRSYFARTGKHADGCPKRERRRPITTAEWRDGVRIDYEDRL